MNAEKQPPLMMGGTESKQSYLVIARRGGFALGVKPEAVLDGKAFGHDGTTWFGARLRSAMAGGLFDTMPINKVVSIKDMMLTTATAWPEVVWENTNETRSSTVIGVLLHGRPLGTDEEVKMFLDEVDKGKLASKLADYVATLAGEENLVIPVSEIQEWLDQYYKGLVAQIMDAVNKKNAIKQEMEAQIGVFGMQAQILKKALEKAQETSKSGEAEDKEPPAAGV
ncbi:MAG: hypothetical protein M9945_14285 [Aquamicrobium sp.]|uniref:hypothetical protein n=1 Tax=Aquamicrobium sp. TaxID=1872579 RepID=UPI00349EAB56|nr:hypothetical protein [Aquamicrobium sp.]